MPYYREGLLQVKALIPIWVQGSLADGGRLGLLAIDGSDSERVRKACSDQSSAKVDSYL